MAGCSVETGWFHNADPFGIRKMIMINSRIDDLTPPGGPPPKRRKPRIDRAARQAGYVRIAAQTFHELGLQRASMRDVADRAGVAKILIYRQFPSKDALLAAVFEEVLQEIRAVYDSPWPGYGAALMEVLRRARDNRAAYLLLLRDSRSDPEAKRWYDIYEARQIEPFRIFLKPAEGAPPGAEERADLGARSLVGIATETLINWIEDRDGLDDAARVRWFGHIVREWRRATRAAYGLDPDEPAPDQGRPSTAASRRAGAAPSRRSS
jgi:AcrR family transcriptional regulator